MKALKVATTAALFAVSALLAAPASAASNPLFEDCMIRGGCQKFADGSWLCYDPNVYWECWAQYGE